MAESDPAGEYFDLGTYARTVTTRSPEAQVWFDRGLNWTYAFNHEEAADCFTRAIDLDAACAMAYWGLAYALGPNYNKPWEAFEQAELVTSVERTHDAVQRALTVADASPVEQALIRALRFRYPEAFRPRTARSGTSRTPRRWRRCTRTTRTTSMSRCSMPTRC